MSLPPLAPVPSFSSRTKKSRQIRRLMRYPLSPPIIPPSTPDTLSTWNTPSVEISYSGMTTRLPRSRPSFLLSAGIFPLVKCPARDSIMNKISTTLLFVFFFFFLPLWVGSFGRGETFEFVEYFLLFVIWIDWRVSEGIKKIHETMCFLFIAG